ncbi:MAG: efflux RND transporter periplasmic adaptor subunit [Actinomycetota bacterium]|nr:efflux RND transporter periplasmic adaptor subunit [Actinomycetota bacterium]
MAVSKKLRRHKGWIAAVVLVAVAGTAYAVLQRSKAEEPTTSYTTEAATIGTLSVTVSGTGNVEVDGATDVYPAASGTVASVKVKEGESVKKGAVLFTLDAATAEANTAKALASYRQSQQSVAQADAQLLKANNSLESLEDLQQEQESGTTAETPTSGTGTQATTEVTDADIEAAEADVASAKASVSSAKASRSSSYLAYEQVKDAEDDLTVKAPASGIIWSLDVAKGDSVSPAPGSGSAASSASGTAASSSSAVPVVIAPKQPFAIHLTVNEVDLPTLALDQRADIEFSALPEVTATGKVYEIGSEGTNTQGVITYDVWLSLDVADPALREVMSASATIVTEVARNALLVPNAALKSAADGTSYVQVLDSGATEPRQVTVEIGLGNATQTQVVSGLSEGNMVVTQTSDSSDSDSEPGGGFGIPGMGGGPRG